MSVCDVVLKARRDAAINFFLHIFFCRQINFFIVPLTQGLSGYWWLYLFRYILLFSSIIPISLRVNLDMAKTLYSYWVSRDADMPGAVCLLMLTRYLRTYIHRCQTHTRTHNAHSKAFSCVFLLLCACGQAKHLTSLLSFIPFIAIPAMLIHIWSWLKIGGAYIEHSRRARTSVIFAF